MENQEIKKLPFWDTVARSFKYVLKNRALLVGILPVIAALSVLQILIGMPFMCSINETTCDGGWGQMVTLLTIILASVGIIINYCRAIIAKAEVDFVSLKFWKKMGLYLIASFILSVMILIPIMVGIFLMSFAFDPNALISLTTSLTLLISIATSIAIAPLFLVFPAIAVEDFKIIRWSKLFQMAKGNHNAIFWAQFVIMMPYWLVSRMWTSLYGIIGLDNYVINLIFVVGGIALGIIDASFKGAFFAHIYQFFKFYDKD